MCNLWTSFCHIRHASPLFSALQTRVWWISLDSCCWRPGCNWLTDFCWSCVVLCYLPLCLVFAVRSVCLCIVLSSFLFMSLLPLVSLNCLFCQPQRWRAAARHHMTVCFFLCHIPLHLSWKGKVFFFSVQQYNSKSNSNWTRTIFSANHFQGFCAFIVIFLFYFYVFSLCYFLSLLCHFSHGCGQLSHFFLCLFVSNAKLWLGVVLCLFDIILLFLGIIVHLICLFVMYLCLHRCRSHARVSLPKTIWTNWPATWQFFFSF